MTWTFPAAPVALLATTFVALLSFWMGTLFSVSWLSGRARLMADGPEIGRLAMNLQQRWTTPALLASLAAGVAWLAGSPPDLARARWVSGIGAALLILLMLHMTVRRRVTRIVRGSVRATQGDGFRRLAMVLSLGVIVMLAGMR